LRDQALAQLRRMRRDRGERRHDPRDVGLVELAPDPDGRAQLRRCVRVLPHGLPNATDQLVCLGRDPELARRRRALPPARPAIIDIVEDLEIRIQLRLEPFRKIRPDDVAVLLEQTIRRIRPPKRALQSPPWFRPGHRSPLLWRSTERGSPTGIAQTLFSRTHHGVPTERLPKRRTA